MASVWTSVAIVAVGAMVGSAMGFLVALKISRAQRIADFRQRQLSDFYSPMAGWVRRARAFDTFDQRIWKEYAEADAERFRKRVEYANEQQKKEILPLYRKMLDHFTNNYWLAEDETRAFYQDFLEFVEIWDMTDKEVLPQELRERFRPDMSRVTAFFDHLEAMIRTLRQELAPSRS
jgi:hypothetical protein